MYNDYIPKPVDTSGVDLSEEMLLLVKVLAYNLHEEQSLKLKNAGWRFGDSMRVDKRTHPNLMPYDELTDIQKERYLSIVLSIVRTMLAMGYDIRK